MMAEPLEMVSEGGDSIAATNVIVTFHQRGDAHESSVIGIFILFFNARAAPCERYSKTTIAAADPSLPCVFLWRLPLSLSPRACRTVFCRARRQSQSWLAPA